MNKLKSLFAFLCVMYALNGHSQVNIQWDWYTPSNVMYFLEYQNGYIYALGNFTNASVNIGANTLINQGGSDFIIAKLDTLGNVIWANSIGGSGNEFAYSMTFGGNGNIYVSGSFVNTLSIGNDTLVSVGSSDIFVAQFDINGNAIMATQAGGPNADAGEDIAVDANGNIYTISNSGDIPFAALTSPTLAKTLLKFDPFGIPIKMKWMQGTAYQGHPPSQDYSLNKIIFSPYDHSVIVGGVFQDGAIGFNNPGGGNQINYGTSNQDIFLWKADTSFTQITFSNITTNINKTNVLSDMCIGNGGKFYCAQRQEYSLNGYGYNQCIEYDQFLNASNAKMFAFSAEPYSSGKPIQIYFSNNILYGSFYQTFGPTCVDFYAAKWDVINNTTLEVSLGPSQSFFGGLVGFNGRYYMSSEDGIRKSCETNCNNTFTIYPAPDVTLCPNASIQIGNSDCFYASGGLPGYTFSWSPTTGLNNPTLSSPTVSGLAVNTTYTLTVTDQNNMMVYDTVNVTLGILPNITLTASVNPICLGDTTTFAGSGGVSYIYWNVPFNYAYPYATVFPNITTTYLVTGTDANGCSNTATITITVNDTSSSSITETICINQIPYLWGGLSIDSPGVYTALYTNIAGCDSLATLFLNISVCGQCQNNFTVNWSPFVDSLVESQTWIQTSGMVLIPVGSKVKFDANTGGNVTLNPGFKVDSGAVFVAQAYNGCTAGSPQLPQLGKMLNADPFAMNAIILYPNPTSGMIHIQHDEKLAGIQIFDMVGKIIINQKCQDETETNIDLTHLPNGVYHVKAAGYQSIKVIKNH